jgi:hypothetical protein
LREGVSRFGGCIHGLQFCEAGLGKRGIPSSTSEWATRSPGRVAVPRAALSADTSDSSAQLHRAKVRSAGAGLGV